MCYLPSQVCVRKCVTALRTVHRYTKCRGIVQGLTTIARARIYCVQVFVMCVIKQCVQRARLFVFFPMLLHFCLASLPFSAVCPCACNSHGASFTVLIDSCRLHQSLITVALYTRMNIKVSAVRFFTHKLPKIVFNSILPCMLFVFSYYN
jgi:hypothetical protein